MNHDVYCDPANQIERSKYGKSWRETEPVNCPVTAYHNETLKIIRLLSW